MSLAARVIFYCRVRWRFRTILRRLFWNALGAQIHPTTSVSRLEVTWPHQIKIGAECILEPDIYFKFDGLWAPGPKISLGNRVFVGRGCEFNIRAGLEIDDDCLIASGCKFIDHDHGTASGALIRTQENVEASIHVMSDVWIGVNAVILKGVILERGAIVAAGAVVTKSVPSYEVWAGIPARKIGTRSDKQLEEAQETAR